MTEPSEKTELERLAIACPHDKVFKHQKAILNRFGEPVSFGAWCEDGRFVTFDDLAKDYAVEMVAALINAGVLDKGGKNPHIDYWE